MPISSTNLFLILTKVHLLSTLSPSSLGDLGTALAALGAYMEAISCGFLVVLIELFYKRDDLLLLELGEILYVDGI